MKIDIHNHFYPGGFLEQLKKDGASVDIRVEKDAWGRSILVQGGNRVVTITEPMSSIDKRLEDMARVGFDKQILTLSIPSVDIFPVKVARDLSRLVNDEFAEIARENPEHFMAFATLPFMDPDGAVRELERCIEQLGFKGACIGSNINGINLDDERLYPFYERMADYDLPIHIHPRASRDKETFKDYRLGPMIGFEVDLSVAVVRIVMGGVLERYPKLRFCFSHLGGAVPFLRERMEAGYKVFPACSRNIPKPPSEYLKRMYFDTAGKSGVTPPSFHKPAFQCAFEATGSDRLLLGTDHPFGKGNMVNAVRFIEELDFLSQKDKEKILSENAIRLLGL